MSQIDLTWLHIDWWLVVVIVICVIAFAAVTVNWGIRAHRGQIGAGREELIGKTAEVRVALEPKGVVFIQGEQWTAVSEAGRLEPGEEVIISKVDGLRLYVTKKQ
ncbi:NfeD family protein [Chloroflexota bacterium]